MPNALSRLIRMLELVPRTPRSTTAPDIRIALERLGYSIDLRTVQRDLNALSDDYPLIRSEDRPARWSWSDTATALHIPSMEPVAALALQMVKSDLLRRLPRPLISQLEPYFDAAATALARLPGISLKRWRDRVQVLPFALQLEPPQMSDTVIEALHQALLQRRKLDLAYIPRTDGIPETKRYSVNPLGLVIHGAAYYLIATLFDYPDICQLAVHRIREAHVLDETVQEPAGFSLTRYIEEERPFDYPVGKPIPLKPIRLQLQVTTWLAQHLAEQCLAADQVLKPSKDAGWHRLAATVMDTQKLRWWIRALGPNAIVTGPAKLRRDFENDLREICANYSHAASRRVSPAPLS